jgi:ubiquinone/menaquinone biosynthesis C-methylase UbiE
MCGEELDLASESVEAVIGTLVLCSVDDPAKVTAEVYRILRPGGRYIFLEHVAAPEGSRLRSFQEIMHKPWHRLFDGCNLNLNTHSLLLNAGFSTVDMNCFMLRARLVPVTPHIFGLAVK